MGGRDTDFPPSFSSSVAAGVSYGAWEKGRGGGTVGGAVRKERKRGKGHDLLREKRGKA